jgi:hypothetical protein
MPDLAYDRDMPSDPAKTLEQPPRRGLLIVAEGLDGSGKSATLDGLARWLERRGAATCWPSSSSSRWTWSSMVTSTAPTPGLFPTGTTKLSSRAPAPS